MKALLLSAGLGTRLRPLTNHTPKCLVPIQGKALLDIWLDQLNAVGVTNYLINTHHLSEIVTNHVNNCSYRERISLAHESCLLGTAGTLAANIDFFKPHLKDSWLIHADNYCLANLAEFKLAHENRPKGCLMTMLTFRTNNPQSCGIVEVNEDGIVIGFHEKIENPPGNQANGAIYLLAPEFFQKFSKEFMTMTDFSEQVIGACLGQIFAFETPSLLLDIGTPETYALVKAR
jgi:mannose-1-phosphate guanylyltransferase